MEGHGHYDTRPGHERVVLVVQSRGCPLKGLPSTPTLEAHRQRFLTNNWEKAESVDLDTIYKYHLDPEDKRRLA